MTPSDPSPPGGPEPGVPPAALVTGAAKRIGRAIALDLAAQGFAVGVHYNESARGARAVVAEIEEAGGRAAALKADLARETDVVRLVGETRAALGPVGLLVNNASLFEKDDALGATRESWDAHMETNLRAPFVLIQDFARQLPGDAEGLVVNILDQRVLSLTPYFTSYTLSKAGLWALTRTLALALAPRIRVNGIGPGPTLANDRQDAGDFAAQAEAVPLARATDPGDIARAIRFMLRARSMTGQMIALDGGEHLGWAQEALGVTPRE